MACRIDINTPSINNFVFEPAGLRRDKPAQAKPAWQVEQLFDEATT